MCGACGRGVDGVYVVVCAGCVGVCVGLCLCVSLFQSRSIIRD